MGITVMPPIKDNGEFSVGKRNSPSERNAPSDGEGPGEKDKEIASQFLSQSICIL